MRIAKLAIAVILAAACSRSVKVETDPASGKADVPVGLNEAKNYIINVHASPTNLGTIVACGDFND